MALIRCPICGEKYDETYKYCPFCEEEDALERGVQIRRNTRRGGRRAAGRDMSILTPTLTVLILIMAALLVYLLFGDTIAEKLGMGDPSDVQVEDPVVQPEKPGVETPDPGVTTPEVEDPAPVVALDYTAAAALPAGLHLSTTDFSLFNPGESHTITVSGGNGNYQWFTENPAVATVDAVGKVMALSRGTIHVVVTDGEKQGTCIVRCSLPGNATAPVQPQPSAPSTTTPTTPEQAPSGTSGLKAGSGKVINAGGGVRVRAQANTTSEILATLSNGSAVNIVESAGDGWYKITFIHTGGVNTTGYMKGDYLANK